MSGGFPAMTNPVDTVVAELESLYWRALQETGEIVTQHGEYTDYALGIEWLAERIGARIYELDPGKFIRDLEASERSRRPPVVLQVLP
jgi:hypothetical protein